MNKPKNERRIMVLERETLLGARPFQGFLPAREFDYESIVLNNYRYAPRGSAEEDPSLKQPIAYCMIVNPEKRLIFTYRRAEGSGYAEMRLRGKWSIGIGGHIDPGDLGGENPIRASMMREMGEEISLDNAGEPRIIGYINDDVDLVGKVHFGLLYVRATGASFIAPRSREIAEARMVTAGEWSRMLDDPSLAIEGWSRIASGELLREIEGEREKREAPGENRESGMPEGS